VNINFPASSITNRRKELQVNAKISMILAKQEELRKLMSNTTMRPLPGSI